MGAGKEGRNRFGVEGEVGRGGLVMGRYCVASGIVLGGLVMGWLWVGNAFMGQTTMACD